VSADWPRAAQAESARATRGSAVAAIGEHARHRAKAAPRVVQPNHRPGVGEAGLRSLTLAASQPRSLAASQVAGALMAPRQAARSRPQLQPTAQADSRARCARHIPPRRYRSCAGIHCPHPLSHAMAIADAGRVTPREAAAPPPNDLKRPRHRVKENPIVSEFLERDTGDKILRKLPVVTDVVQGQACLIRRQRPPHARPMAERVASGCCDQLPPPGWETGRPSIG
jgi:hypothetical protein